jgi:hypothetical protein
MKIVEVDEEESVAEPPKPLEPSSIQEITEDEAEEILAQTSGAKKDAFALEENSESGMLDAILKQDTAIIDTEEDFEVDFDTVEIDSTLIKPEDRVASEKPIITDVDEDFEFDGFDEPATKAMNDESTIVENEESVCGAVLEEKLTPEVLECNSPHISVKTVSL